MKNSYLYLCFVLLIYYGAFLLKIIIKPIIQSVTGSTVKLC